MWAHTVMDTLLGGALEHLQKQSFAHDQGTLGLQYLSKLATTGLEMSATCGKCNNLISEFHSGEKHNPI